jgi:hypothetical protein
MFSIPAGAAREFDADPDLLCILIPIQILIQIQPKVLQTLDNQKKFLVLFTAVSVYIVYLSLQRLRCLNFQYFGQHIEISGNMYTVVKIYFRLK